MKKSKFFSLFSTTLICSSLMTTIPVSAADAKNGNVSVNPQNQVEQQEKNVPNTTTSFVLTKNDDKKTVDNTVNYIKSQGIKVKSVIPEIGWIETDRTSQQQEKKIEKNTNADVQTPDKKANDSYTPTAIPSSSDPDNPMNKYLWDRQWNMHMMSKDPEKYVNDKNSHVKVGIIDSGITSDYRNELGSKVRYTENFVPQGGFNNQDNDENGNANDVEDRIGHGTSVTSLIMGTDEMVGVNPNVTVDEYRVFSQKGCNPSWVLKALVKAVDNGDDVINMSLGRYGIITGGYYGQNGYNDLAEYQAWTRAVEYAKQHGSTVVVAAGNESLNLDDSQAITNYINKKNPQVHAQGQGASLPASVPGIIQVAATGNQGERSEYSCYSKDSVYAPGGDSNRTGIDNPIQQYIPTDWLLTYSGHNGQYSFGLGTSFSAPEVTGMIAHEISENNLYNNPDGVKSKLQSSLETNKYGLPCVTLNKLVGNNSNSSSKNNSSHNSSSKKVNNSSSSAIINNSSSLISSNIISSNSSSNKSSKSSSISSSSSQSSSSDEGDDDWWNSNWWWGY